ncbi:MAG: DUF4926 domain-containing protein [Spirosomataceae bacterium]
MFQETELVALLIDLPNEQLHRGDVGTVAFVYDGGGLYEVEFVNAAGDTLAVVTLEEATIYAVQPQNAILHVTDLPVQNAA